MIGRFVTLGIVSVIVILGSLIVGTPAEALSCVGAGHVAALGASGCTPGGSTFNDFTVAAVGFNGAKVFLSPLSATVGQDANLHFQVAHDPSPTGLSDIFLFYAVTADPGRALNGVDLFNRGQKVTIREVVCGNAFVNRVCGTAPLANLVVSQNSSLAANFDPDSTIFIRKDIQFLNNAFISELTQSDGVTEQESRALTPVPEPAILVLLGSTLAGLGMASRKRVRCRSARP